MNASQLTMIKEAKKLLIDCSCFRGPEGPPGSNGSTIVGPIGPTGPIGPPGTLSSFSIVGASTNALLYYDGFKPAGMSSLFYYSTINVLQANLDIVPCTDNVYSLGSSNSGRWKDLFLGPSSLYLGYKAKVYEDVLGNVTTDTGFHGYNLITSTMNIGNSVGYQLSVLNQDLFAQQYDSTGPNGTLYPLLHPIGYISTSQLTSTIDGLGTYGYISTSQLLSSFQGVNYIIQPETTSSLIGLGTFNYISSSQLQSTVMGVGNIYVSSQSLISTTNSLQNSILSTNIGLGTIGYISSLSLFSTTQAFENQLLSTNTGLGVLGYISSAQLISTTSGLATDIINIQNGLGVLGYISSSQLISTVTGLGSLYISSSQLLSTTVGLEALFLSSLNVFFPSTVIGLGAASYISTQSLISTTNALQNFVQSNVNSTAVGLANVGYISSQSLISTTNALQDAITSTNKGLANIGYISTSALTSTIVGLGNLGYISSSQMVSTVNGFTINTRNALQSTTTGLGNIYVSSIINNAFGKILRVDSIYGNDTLALQNQYGYPFSTISAAMYCASTQDQVWLLPGTYNEQVIFKTGVNIRGVNLNSVFIQQANVTQPTTLITFINNNRLEDVTLNLTSKTTVASTLVGVLFSSCQDNCKLRASLITVNNSGLTDNTRPTNVYGVYSAGYSSTIYTANDNIQRTTINVTSAGTGPARCIYNDNSNRISMRDTNLFCTDAYNPTYTGGNYIGIETVNISSIVQIKNSSVNGNVYNAGNTSADISQTKGQIIVTNTDLVNKNANFNAFITNQTLNIINFGISGALSNFQYIGGPNGISNNWSNTFLFPGTQNFTTVTSDIVQNYNFLRIPNTNIITNFGIQAQRGTAAGISSFAVLYKNGYPVSTPNFILPLVGASSFFLSTSTLTLKATDTYGIYISTNSSNTTLSNIIVSMSLF